MNRGHIFLAKFGDTNDFDHHPLREDPFALTPLHLGIARCQDESVTTISLHGAVAGSVAPRAHTALRASNLRLKTSNFTLFHQQR